MHPATVGWNARWTPETAQGVGMKERRLLNPASHHGPLRRTT
jgi:hypothetical protein